MTVKDALSRRDRGPADNEHQRGKRKSMSSAYDNLTQSMGSFHLDTRPHAIDDIATN